MQHDANIIKHMQNELEHVEHVSIYFDLPCCWYRSRTERKDSALGTSNNSVELGAWEKDMSILEWCLVMCYHVFMFKMIQDYKLASSSPKARKIMKIQSKIIQDLMPAFL